MARRRDDLDELPSPSPGGVAGSKDRVYDWKHWTDGAIWELRAGEDFEVDIESLRSQLGAAARRRGLVVETRWNRETQTVLVRFTPRPA